jgi:hypothetical protein
MDPKRFDALTRFLVAPATRRRAVAAASGGLAALLGHAVERVTNRTEAKRKKKKNKCKSLLDQCAFRCCEAQTRECCKGTTWECCGGTLCCPRGTCVRPAGGAPFCCSQEQRCGRFCCPQESTCCARGSG